MVRHVLPNAPLCNSSRSRRLAAATNSSRRLDIQVTVGTSSQPVGRPVGRPVHQPAMVATAKVAQVAAAHSSGMRRTERSCGTVLVCACNRTTGGGPLCGSSWREFSLIRDLELQQQAQLELQAITTLLLLSQLLREH